LRRISSASSAYAEAVGMIRVAVITGGAGMLGAAVAAQLPVAEIDRTVLVDLSGDRLRATAARLRASGRDVREVVCDVADSIAIAAVADQIAGSGWTPSVLVNAAGVPGRTGTRSCAEDVSEDDWERTLRTNLTGAFLWCRAVIPGMRRAGYGRIVNVSSLAGRTASATASLPYTVSKSGLLGLTRALAVELAPHGILVNAVAPSRIANSTWPSPSAAAPPPPIGRIAEADEVAAAIVFLASERNSYAAGVTLDVNGAQFVA
jgi:3-oxoacyl-[acyl-carrier protein] reductase